MSPDQISLFDSSRGKGRADNDANNTAREKILEACAAGLPEECVNDPEYGEKWRTLSAKFDEKIRAMTTTEFDRYVVQRKAGRNYNYDFLVTFYKTDVQVDIVKVEFKFGVRTIGELPQFYQKSTTWEIMSGPLYHEFFYDRGYLAEMMALDPNAPEMVDRETYLRFVKQTNYDCHPIFRYLYDNEEIQPQIRKKIVKQSITDYLTENEANFQLPAFLSSVQQSQEGKKYLMYSGGDLYIEEFSFLTDPDMAVFKGIVRNNTYVVSSGNYQFGLLLRWKNHQGVLNPAWQVSVKSLIK
jgi:hypothetical protein